MEIIFLLFFSALGCIGLAAYFISTRLYRRAVVKQNSYPKAIRVVSFIASFLLMSALMIYIFSISFRFER